MVSSLPKLHLATLLTGLFHLFSVVDAALYVVTPRDRSTCRGSQPCTVTWLDDGRAPLLSAIGVSTVGLYTGTRKLVQSLPPLDVSQTLSFTFTPDPAVGPNSGAYYIAFTSTEAMNGTEPYSFYSPWFRLEGMTGSFDNPVPSATRTRPIPTSLTASQSTTEAMSTITVGTLSTSITDSLTTSLPTPTVSPSASTTSSPSSSSGFSTSRTTPAAASTTGATPLGNENAAMRSSGGAMTGFVALGIAVVISSVMAS